MAKGADDPLKPDYSRFVAKKMKQVSGGKQPDLGQRLGPPNNRDGRVRSAYHCVHRFDACCHPNLCQPDLGQRLGPPNNRGGRPCRHSCHVHD